MYQSAELILKRLQRSPFRMRFHLNTKDSAYYQEKGCDIILSHAYDFINSRLAPAFPPNDGKQTPMRGHPVFVAQHATATCCRGCLEKWHYIEKGKVLTEAEKEYIVNFIAHWLEYETSGHP